MQLMKVVGVTDVSEFDNLVKQHAPQIENFDQTFKKHSPFDLQMVLMKEQIEGAGINNYQNLKTTEDKIEYVYEILIKDPEFKDVTKMCLKRKSEKDAEKSKRSRDLGNKNFQKKVNEEAIRYYNESILTGPIENGKGKDVSLGLGNRSVVFYNLQEYDNCLQDIEGALAFGYPEELRYKVFERQGRCHQALGKYEEARQSFEKALACMEQAKATEEKKVEIKADLEKSISEIQGDCENQPIALLNSRNNFKIWSPHKQFPNMADCLEIKYTPSAGRHGIAADNIAPGEIILIEDPVAWTVNPNQFSSVCQNCACQVGRTPFPSPRHEAAVFCSYTCLTQFHRIFGKYDDLPFVELFASGGAEGSASLMLAFRCLVQKPSSWYIEHKANLFSEYNAKYGIDEPEGWKLEGDENIYKAIFNLVNHIEKLTIDKELIAIIKSVVLLRYLICSEYFPGYIGDSKTLTDEQSFIGKLLFQFNCGVTYNQHGVYEAQGAIEAGKKLPLVDVGAAFYPNMVLLNHSCCPNTIRINQGKKTYLVAKHVIKKGQEVTDCYGMHHLSNTKAERVPLIESGFLFNCKCKACMENWTTLPQLESRLSQAEMGKLGTLLSKYQSHFREHKFEKASSFCVEYLKKMDELKIIAPHRNYEIASMALSSCFWASLQ